jgi:hypothetical protein
MANFASADVECGRAAAVSLLVLPAEPAAALRHLLSAVISGCCCCCLLSRHWHVRIRSGTQQVWACGLLVEACGGGMLNCTCQSYDMVRACARALPRGSCDGLRECAALEGSECLVDFCCTCCGVHCVGQQMSASWYVAGPVRAHTTWCHQLGCCGWLKF